MALSPDLANPSPLRLGQSRPAPRQPHQPPPMREVTKGWFTMREEPKTIEELREADREQR